MNADSPIPVPEKRSAPAEGDAGLTDEQANALAAFYDVSPGTVRDIYALSKPKAAPNPQPKGTAVDLTDDDIITELHRHTQRYTDDRLDYIIDPSEAVAFARAAIAADRALQATAPAMHSTALAGLILTHLGYSTEPSLEPGADMRRDALARRLGEWLSPATQAPAPVAEPELTDEQIVAHLEAAGVELQRFMGGVSGTKDCWSTAGSQDVRKIAAGVRAAIATVQAPAVAPQKPLTDAKFSVKGVTNDDSRESSQGYVFV